jgi:hypothetical protein
LHELLRELWFCQVDASPSSHGWRMRVPSKLPTSVSVGCPRGGAALAVVLASAAAARAEVRLCSSGGPVGDGVGDAVGVGGCGRSRSAVQ